MSQKLMPFLYSFSHLISQRKFAQANVFLYIAHSYTYMHKQTRACMHIHTQIHAHTHTLTLYSDSDIPSSTTDTIIS